MANQVWVWAAKSNRRGVMIEEDINHMVSPVTEEEGSGFFTGYALCWDAEEPWLLSCLLGEAAVYRPCGNCLAVLFGGRKD